MVSIRTRERAVRPYRGTHRMILLLAQEKATFLGGFPAEHSAAVYGKAKTHGENTTQKMVGPCRAAAYRATLRLLLPAPQSGGTYYLLCPPVIHRVWNASV